MIRSLLDTIIWGSVSDWSLVLIAAVTAYYLYKTLKSQKEVQRTQTELFRIESIRFRESIKPVLKYAASTDKIIPGDKNKKILTVEVINETDSMALEISRIVSQNDQSPQIFIPTGLSDRRTHLVKGDDPMMFHFLLEEIKVYSWATFSLTYQDVAGTKYKQGVICICDPHGIELNPFLPEIQEN
jgi:hypothetical protein